MAAEAIQISTAPALPPLETRETMTRALGPSREESTTTLSDEQNAALSGLATNAAAEIDVAKKKADQERRIAAAEQADVVEQQRIAAWEQAQASSPQAQAVNDYVAKMRARTADSEERLTRMPPPALFADRNGWEKVKLAVGMGLGGLSEGMMAAAHLRLGMAAPQQHTVDSIIGADIDRQKNAIDKLRDEVAMNRTGIADAERAKAALKADIDLRAAQMYKSAGLLLKGRLAALKYDQAAIDQDSRVVDINKRRAEYRADYVKAHTDNVRKTWDAAKQTNETINRTLSPTNDGTGKLPATTAALARQAIAEAERLEKAPALSEDALEKLQDNALNAEAANAATEKGTLVGGAIARGGRALGAVPRTRYDGLAPRDRITAVGMDAMVTTLTHLMTGAGSPAEEARKKAEQFGFVPGETRASMTDKIRRAKELAGQYVNVQGSPASAAPRPRSIGAGAPAAEPANVRAARSALEPGSKADAEDRAKAREIMADWKRKQRGL